MAAPRLKIHARQKWKPVVIDSVLASQGLIDGLAGIEELHDYEIVKVDKKRKTSTERTSQLSKKIKKNEAEPAKKKALHEGSVQVEVKGMPDGKTARLTRDSERQDVHERPNRKTRKQQKIKLRREVGTLDGSQLKETDLHSVDMSAWKDLFVPEPVLSALASLGYISPTTIQVLSLPSAIRDRMDIVGAAETGSGKTLAFGIPIIHRILNKDEERRKMTSPPPDNADEEKDVEEEISDMPSLSADALNELSTEVPFVSREPEEALHTLILTPTRELAIQVKNHIKAAAMFTAIKIIAIVGGIATQKQRRLLRKRPDIIVATPGRLWELLQEGDEYLKTVVDIKCLVIDEADRMLEKGHFAELSQLLELINSKENRHRQTFVLSATLTMIHDIPKRLVMKKKKRKLAQNNKLDALLHVVGVKEHPKIVDVTQKVGTAGGIHEAQLNCPAQEKDYYLYYFLARYPGRTLVFCNSVDCVRRLVNVFGILQKSPLPLHSSMHQKQRLKNLERFAASEHGLLLATDVAARGLDIPSVQHVIHYQVPRTSETYVHRSGRTARAHHEGLSVLFIDPQEVQFYRRMCRTLSREEDLPLFPVDVDLLAAARPIVALGRELDLKEHRWRRENSQNNWFQKMAKDMDIELDDDNLLNDLGGEYEKSQAQRELKTLRKRLNALIKKPVMPKKNLGSYPTKMGKLVLPKSQATDTAIVAMKKEKVLQKSILDEITKDANRKKNLRKAQKKRDKRRNKANSVNDDNVDSIPDEK